MDLPAAFDLVTEARSSAAAARHLAKREARVRTQLGRWWGKQGRMFRQSLARYRSSWEDVTEAVGEDRWGPLWERVARQTRGGIVPLLDEQLRGALEAGAVETIVSVGAEISFDLKNPRAVAWLKDRAAAEVTRIDTETMSRLRTLLVQAGDEGWSWTRTARQITSTFDGFSGRGPMGRHLRNRAELVAVTEMADAYGEGNHLARLELAAAGLDVEKRWVTVGDDRVSDGCRANGAAGWVAHDEAFPSGGTREPRFPGCRCVTVTRVKTDRGDD